MGRLVTCSLPELTLVKRYSWTGDFMFVLSMAYYVNNVNVMDSDSDSDIYTI